MTPETNPRGEREVERRPRVAINRTRAIPQALAGAQRARLRVEQVKLAKLRRFALHHGNYVNDLQILC